MPKKSITCRNLLRQEVSSGRLDAAESKAEVLGSLCEKLNFDPDTAAALHRQLYRQKIDSLLEKKSLTGSQSHISCKFSRDRTCGQSWW